MTGPIVRHPTIVVGVPFFNEARYLEETLRSLQRQDLVDFAVLMTDNCSDDESGAIARKFAEDDERFTLFTQPQNIGSIANFVFSLDNSESPFFMWLGGHDLLEPDFLSRHLCLMIADPTLSLTYCYAKTIDASGLTVSIGGDHILAQRSSNLMFRYFRAVRNAYGYQIHGVIRRTAFEGFRHEKVVNWDKVLLSHLAFRGHMACVPAALFTFRDVNKLFEDKPSSSMQRITGLPAAMPDKYAPMKYYLSNFEELAKGKAFYKIYRFLIKSLILFRLEPRRPGVEAIAVRYAVRLLRAVKFRSGVARSA